MTVIAVMMIVTNIKNQVILSTVTININIMDIQHSTNTLIIKIIMIMEIITMIINHHPIISLKTMNQPMTKEDHQIQGLRITIMEEQILGEEDMTTEEEIQVEEDMIMEEEGIQEVEDMITEEDTIET